MSYQALLICGWKQPFQWMQPESTQYAVPSICINFDNMNIFITKRDYVLSYKEWKVILSDRGKVVLMNVIPFFHSPSHNLVMFRTEDKNMSHMGCFYKINTYGLNFSTSRGKIEILSYNDNELSVSSTQKIMIIKKMIYKKIGMEDQNIYVELENTSINSLINICGSGVWNHGNLLGMIIANDTRQFHFLMMPTNNILHFINLYRSGLNNPHQMDNLPNQFQIIYPDMKDIIGINSMMITNKTKPPDTSLYTSVYHPDFSCMVPLKFLFWYHALEKMTIMFKNNTQQYYKTQFAQNIYPLTELPLHLNKNWILISYHKVEYEIVVNLSGDVMQSIADMGMLETNRLTKITQEFFDGTRFDKKRIAFNSLISSFRMIDYSINYPKNKNTLKKLNFQSQEKN
jgi:hypothetical protein